MCCAGPLGMEAALQVPWCWIRLLLTVGRVAWCPPTDIVVPFHPAGLALGTVLASSGCPWADRCTLW